MVVFVTRSSTFRNMIKFAAIAFLLTALTSHCAVIKENDVARVRVARCSTCGSGGLNSQPPGPPPPPPHEPPPYGPPPHGLPPTMFRTQQWSGYARSKDGQQHEVFSGSAAATGNGKQTSDQAVALASSSIDSSLFRSNTQSVGSGYSHSGSQNFQNQGQPASIGYNNYSNGQSQPSNEYTNNESLAPNQAGGRFDNNDQQIQNLGYGPSGNERYQNGKNIVGTTHSSQNGQDFVNDNTRNFAYQGREAESDRHQISELPHQDGQAQLGGALDLARGGLQAAQQTASQQAGCATCGKNTYAFSKAKSNSGSAVAISVSG